jgi:hypothetical protein
MPKLLPITLLSLLAWLLPLLGCNTIPTNQDAQAQASATAPGFVQLHEAFFVPSCSAEACHSGSVGVAGLSFDDPEKAYETLLDGTPINPRAAELGFRLVKNGEPSQSFLLHKLVTDSLSLSIENLGSRMPIGGLNAPGPKTLEALDAWISAGAPYEGLDVDADFITNEEEDFYIPCDAEDEEGLAACFGDEPNPDEGLRLRTPAMTVEPGQEILVCSHLELTPDEDIYFRAMKGMQMMGGHHVALYAAFAPLESTEPFPCGSGSEMENYRLLAGAFAGRESLVPDDIALRLPAGQQVVIQSHYINPTSEPLVVMDALDLELTTIDEDDVVADNFVINLSAFEIPPQTTAHEATHTCRAGREMDIYTVIGHTHEHGTLLELEWTNPEGETIQLYSETDGVLMREGGSAIILPEPIHLTPEDTLKVTCRWDNPFDESLTFPDEMCAAIMYYSPAVGFLVCGESDEEPEIFGAEGDGVGCVAQGTPGNALGVGEACTVGGGECDDNTEADFCLGIFDAEANFCSFLGCEEDSDCGEGAVCHAQTAGSACVPFACAGQ